MSNLIHPPTARTRRASMVAELDQMERENGEAPRPCPDLAAFIAKARDQLANADESALADLESTLASFTERGEGADQWPGSLSYLTDDERREFADVLKGS